MRSLSAMSPSRSILLVGEGNFSFSASLSHLCRLTATSLQPQDNALQQEGAHRNIQTIKDSGGSVLFEVDCTKLEECGPLQGRVFELVVFNFPHCGRKSGVKKNRQLLKSFFLSCVQVLAEDGEVHVSLCNGQGGTPFDQPKREWHNSWQVVAMAAEADLVLSGVFPFERGKYHNYKCTGYRSQDKGFHVENALLHVFTRSIPYNSVQMHRIEEDVRGEKVQYNIPGELSDYMFRGFLSFGSVHPVSLVQDYLLEGLTEQWSISMTTEALPFLLTAKQLQMCCHNMESTLCYWINLLQNNLDSNAQTCADKAHSMSLDRQGHMDIENTVSGKMVKENRVRSKGFERLRIACSCDVDPEEESGLYVLRPSLHPQMEELLASGGAFTNFGGSLGEEDGSNKSVEGSEEGKLCESCNTVPSSVLGLSGLVFRNVPVNLWALPVFHELLLRGIFPSKSEPIKSLGRKLETLLAPYGVYLVTEQEGLCLMAQPMGLVGQVYACTPDNILSHVCITLSLNLDLLATLLFQLPDWRLLWSHDPRFLEQFALRPSPGTPFQPFSLFPEVISFDISFWTEPGWEEKNFYAVVREASCGTVEQVKLMDTFSYPDLSQTSYCYRLIYHSHTNALSHTKALLFHKHLESLLSSRLQVTIR